MTPARRDNQVYYFDIAEGLWRGEFGFRISDFRKWWKTPASVIDRTLALMLHANDLFPGQTTMHGEILGAPDEGDAGVARVEVSVRRFGLEIFWLEGHYALDSDGASVAINVHQRYGPPGFPVLRAEPRSATIDRGGYRAHYRIRTLGDDWVGVYDLDEARRQLGAKYACPWGELRENMRRVGRTVPADPLERADWERLLAIARRLESMYRAYDEEQDPRGPFTHAYAAITRRLTASLTEEGYRDPAWVLRLAERFADQYFKAMEDHDRGAAPTSWKLVLDTLESRSLTALDELMLGMYVHIVHDLPRALLQAGMTAPDGSSRIGDFHLVNRVLGEAVDDLQQRIGNRYNILVGVLDRLLDRYDERLSRHGVGAGRALAWYNAVRLSDPDIKHEAVASIDRSVAAFVREALGRSPSRKLALAALRRAARVLRRTPNHPEPATLGAPPQVTGTRDPGMAAAYALHTAVAMKKGTADLTKLGSALGGAAIRNLLGDRAAGLITPLLDPDGWRAHLPVVLDRSPSERYALAALVGDLLEGDALVEVLSELRVSAVEHEAIQAFQEAVRRAVEETTDTAKAALASAAELLADLGIPGTSALTCFDHVVARFDEETETFESTVQAVFREDFADIQHVINPEDWDERISQMVDTHWVDPPANRTLYEEVNILHPWLTGHPLHLHTHLAITDERSDRWRQIDYRLHESLDGALRVDEGYMRVESIGPSLSLVTLHKRLGVADNPVLDAMLRFNPDGLGALLCYWIHEAARAEISSAA